MNDCKPNMKILEIPAPPTTIIDQISTANSAPRPANASGLDIGRYDPSATLIRINQVMALTGVGRATVYKLMNQPESGFPQAVKLTDSNARGAPVAWVLAEVLNWNRARIAARNKVAA